MNPFINKGTNYISFCIMLCLQLRQIVWRGSLWLDTKEHVLYNFTRRKANHNRTAL